MKRRRWRCKGTGGEWETTGDETPSCSPLGFDFAMVSEAEAEEALEPDPDPEPEPETELVYTDEAGELLDRAPPDPWQN